MRGADLGQVAALSTVPNLRSPGRPTSQIQNREAPTESLGTAMTEQQRNSVTSYVRARESRRPRARSNRGATNELQIGLAFEDTAVDAQTPAVRAQTGKQTHRASQDHAAVDPLAIDSADANACLGPDTPSTRGRVPDRSAPGNHSSLGERRLVPSKTESTKSSGRLASIRGGTVAAGTVEPRLVPEFTTAPSVRPVGSSVILLRVPEVTRATGLSKSSIYRLESAGRFPERVQLSKNSVGWREADIAAWVLSRPMGRALRMSGAIEIGGGPRPPLNQLGQRQKRA